uniref:SPARK domain-containing protein n=1 Tax=Chenopodium quinoa TaxID=63459 RepID=A0A803N0C1_CHEQI
MDSLHHYVIIPFILYFTLFYPHLTSAGLLSEPVQPTKPDDYPTTPNTVPAFPLQTDSQTCHLDLSDELFGGVNEACGHNLDRSRCCPVLAAWLYAAQARSALELPPDQPPVTPDSDSVLPMMPESDSQKCVNSLQSSLSKRNITLPQPNSTCDTFLCFCGIRLHQIASLSCPAAFNLTANYGNATPTASVRNLEKNCRNSTYAGCTKCLGALEKSHVKLVGTFWRCLQGAIFVILSSVNYFD